MSLLMPERTEERVEAGRWALEVAEAWVEGRLPAHQAAQAASPADRFMALHFCRGDKRMPHLTALLDVLVAGGGWHRTQHGMFHESELAEAQARPFSVNGHTGWEFPIKTTVNGPVYPSDANVRERDPDFDRSNHRPRRFQRPEIVEEPAPAARPHLRLVPDPPAVEDEVVEWL